MRYNRNQPADNSKEAEEKKAPETEERLDDDGKEDGDVIEPKPITRRFKPQIQNRKHQTV